MRVDWFRLPKRRHCGGCNELFPVGTPMRQLRSGGIRCSACAFALLGEERPSDLESLPSAVIPQRKPFDPMPLQPFVERMRRLLDVKRRQSGDDAA